MDGHAASRVRVSPGKPLKATTYRLLRLAGLRAAIPLLLWLATAAPPLWAQTGPHAGAVANQSGSHWSQTVTFSMRDANIRAVVQWIAEQTGKQVVLDPRVQGKVSLVADQPMTIAQAYQVFLAMLDVHGYAATDLDGILRIYPAPLARTSPRELIEDFTDQTRGGQVMHVLSPQNVTAAAMADLIRPLIGPGGYIGAINGGNSLVLADTNDNVERLAALAHQVDRRGVIDIEVVALTHADAAEVAKVAGSLLAPAGNRDTAARPVTIAADPRSNSILLSGDASRRERARVLLRQLDRPAGGAGSTRVVYLRYMSAEELVPVLDSMTRSTQADAKDVSLTAASVSIEASKSTNALVITGPPPLLDEMESVIERLDVRRAQVLVEAVIVEVSTELGERLGVEWTTDFSGDGVQAGTRFGIANGAAEVLDLLGSGLTLGYWRNGSVRALINALATSSQANILSTPSIMTLDNQPAEIIVGSNIPIVTGQVTSEAAGVTNPFTTYEREDIGVILKITPQINHADAVTLDIVQEVETIAETPVGSGLNGARDIVTNKRSVTTKVLVQDDDILVLGGLISDEKQEIVSKVPVLGDMPLVGRLFRSTTQRAVKRNLMVFIHPVIVDSGEIADNLSRQRYDEMRQHQLEQPRQGATSTAAPTAPLLPEFETFSPAPAAAAKPASTR